MPVEGEEVTPVSVLRELHSFKEQYAGDLVRLQATDEKIDKVAEKAETLAAQALALVQAIAVFTEPQRMGLINLLEAASNEAKDRADFDRQIRLAIIGVLVSGALGIFVWPLLQKLVGG